MKALLKYLILAGILFLAALYLTRNQDILANIKHITPGKLVFLSFVSLLYYFALGYQFKITMLFFDLKLSPSEWFCLTMVNSLLNYILPFKGGQWVRAYYLKEQHDFSYSHYLSSIYGFFILSFLNAASIGILAVLFDSRELKGFQTNMLMIFILLFLAVLAVFCLSYILSKAVKPHLNNRVSRILGNVHEGVRMMMNKPRLILLFWAVNTLIVLLSSVQYYYCIHFLGGTVSWLSAIGVMALASFAIVIALTPGNIGIRELFMTYTCRYMSIPFPLSVLAAGLDRVIHMMIVFIFGGISLRMFFRKREI